MIRAIFSIFALAAAACALAACEQTYDQSAATWPGKDVDTLLESWGPPTSRVKLSDGREILQYARSEAYQVPLTFPTTTTTTIYGPKAVYTGQSAGQQIYGMTVQERCEMRFTVNTSRLIEKVSKSGSGCWHMAAPVSRALNK